MGMFNKNVTSRFDSPSALNLTGAVHCVKCKNIIFHLHSFIQLLWRHMNVKASQTTSNSAICSTNYPGSQQYNQSSTLLAISEGNPLMTGGFPSQRASNAQSISWPHHTYVQVSNIRRTLVIVDHSDVVGASPVGAAPTTSSFST